MGSMGNVVEQHVLQRFEGVARVSGAAGRVEGGRSEVEGAGSGVDYARRREVGIIRRRNAMTTFEHRPQRIDYRVGRFLRGRREGHEGRWEDNLTEVIQPGHKFASIQLFPISQVCYRIGNEELIFALFRQVVEQNNPGRSQAEINRSDRQKRRGIG